MAVIPVDWLEDFTGVGNVKEVIEYVNGVARVKHRYSVPYGWQLSVSPSDGANVLCGPVGAGTGGIWQMGLWGGQSAQNPGVARAIRLRYGGGAPWDYVDARNFSPAKSLHFRARVSLNMDARVSATVGLTGINDPDQVLAALYSGPDTGWVLQARNLTGGVETPQNAANVATRWKHIPGALFDLEIMTDWAARRAVLRIDGADVAEVVGEMLTPQPMCPELQLWNVADPATGIYSAPTMYADYVAVEQER